MNELLAVFVAGLLSSAHCIGMCGGFAALVGATSTGLGRSLLRQLLYSLGRITTYAFFGATGGFAGLYLSRYESSIVSAQQGFSILAGVVMVLIGVWTLLPFRWRVRRGGALSTLLLPLFNNFLRLSGRSGYFLAGLANGFLPCGLVYAFAAKAVATADAIDGTLVMVAFGLGTVPAMTAVGCGATLAGHRVRHHAYRFAACLIILMGILSVQRAVAVGPTGPCHDPGSALPVNDL